MHSSESETNEEDGNGRERKKFTRLSDDEYLSDNLSTFHVQDYKGFEENSGRKRKMYHLKHGVCIKREHWESMKKMFDAKEYIKFFIHSLYKEEDLIDKAFVLGGCKRDRIPGRIRSEFSADEKAAIRKTFFCWVDKTSQNKKQAKYHKNHWKTYISDHINSLIEREKTKNEWTKVKAT
ncbi:uncharacterized protein LOC131673797 [Phymastichus coffea]|uniref:uncharacterized protein LOC131673797 n=1 Tax=Phymastichus coffea TaxID=108790 RepID=UPI00273AFD0C|nr:uncharacterized protein LOC131673797 [Phymastichus coffea]